MIIQLNKHGPRGWPVQGFVSNRGSTPTSPVISPHIMVIKPPGMTGWSHPTMHMHVTDPLRLPLLNQRHREGIAHRYPDTSHPGLPVTNPLQTPQPLNTIQGETEVSFCNGTVLAFSYQLSAVSYQRKKGKQKVSG